MPISHRTGASKGAGLSNSWHAMSGSACFEFLIPRELNGTKSMHRRTSIQKKYRAALWHGSTPLRPAASGPATSSHYFAQENLMIHSIDPARPHCANCQACGQASPPHFVVMRSTEQLRVEETSGDRWLDVSDVHVLATYCSFDCMQTDLVALMTRQGVTLSLLPMWLQPVSTCGCCRSQIDVREPHMHYALEVLDPRAPDRGVLTGCPVAVTCLKCASTADTNANSQTDVAVAQPAH